MRPAALATACRRGPFSPDVAAGVGDSHSWIDDSGHENLHGWAHGEEPFACATCHFDTVIAPGVRTRDANGWSVYEAVPIANRRTHVNGQPDVVFTSSPVWLFDIPFDLTGGAYAPMEKSCADISCHLQQTPVAWGLPFRVDNTYECGLRPPATSLDSSRPSSRCFAAPLRALRGYRPSPAARRSNAVQHSWTPSTPGPAPPG